jgi:hypothetical protein
MSTRGVFPRLVILGLAALGFASGLPKHVKLEVRLDQMLCSETASSGDRFRATLDRDVTLGGQDGAEKGSKRTGSGSPSGVCLERLAGG